MTDTAMDLHKINDGYAVSAQIQPEDAAGLAKAGFVAVICNRPDGEEPGQPTAAEISDACRDAGLGFHHVPVTGGYLTAESVLLHKSIIESADGPVLGYCRSGQRSAMIYESGLS